ncbi:spore germination protein GerPE [Cohnella caldifontis]|uniref:spore germination protein GerPE n=1 Tax=Cohnella caldifontis TaxID=3027471 RepID=UPI0023EE0366|nr:spore germination protein GerPE [Cohnella sp. YIM B05605]
MTVDWRLVRAESLKVVNMFHGAVMQVGDNGVSNPWDWSIALQRAIPDFYGDETRFASYSLFFRPLPAWLPAPDVGTESGGPPAEIRVGPVKVITASASILIRIGCSGGHSAESRILHIRQYNGPPPPTVSAADR